MYSTSARPDMFGIYVPERILKSLTINQIPHHYLKNFSLIEKYLSDEDLLTLLILNNSTHVPTGNPVGCSLFDVWNAQLNKQRQQWLSNILNDNYVLSEQQSYRLKKLFEHAQQEYTANEILVQFFSRNIHGRAFDNLQRTDEQISSQDVVDSTATEDDKIEVKVLSDYAFAIVLKPNLLNLWNLKCLHTKQVTDLDGVTANMLRDIIKLFYVYQSSDRVSLTDWYRLYLQSL